MSVRKMHDICGRCRSPFQPANNRIGRMLREARMCLSCFSVRGHVPAPTVVKVNPADIDADAWRDTPFIKGRIERERAEGARS